MNFTIKAAMQRVFLLTIFLTCLASFPAAAGSNEQPPIDPEQLALLIHEKINQKRLEHGLEPLEMNEQLCEIARNHSRDMVLQHFFSHINPQGEDPAMRGRRQGWDKKKRIDADTWAVGLAENIFLNHLYDRVTTITENGVVVEKQYAWKSQEDIAHSTVKGWMDSLGHRKNLLSPQFDQHGVGVAIDANDVFITQDLF